MCWHLRNAVRICLKAVGHLEILKLSAPQARYKPFCPCVLFEADPSKKKRCIMFLAYQEEVGTCGHQSVPRVLDWYISFSLTVIIPSQRSLLIVSGHAETTTSAWWLRSAFVMTSWWIMKKSGASLSSPPLVSLSRRQVAKYYEVLAGRDVLESHLGCCKGSPGEVGQRLSHSWPWFFRYPGNPMRP